MTPNLTVYNGTAPFFHKLLVKLETGDEDRPGASLTQDEYDALIPTGADPIMCLTTKHTNGSLNLWHLMIQGDSKFTFIQNIVHQTRVCGHRFRLNDINCHPVLPLMLTTSHHNKNNNNVAGSPFDDTPLIRIESSPAKDWCSELILWRVDAVSPLAVSGGVTELSRINSPEISAFSNVAWIPTLLPSFSLGKTFGRYEFTLYSNTHVLYGFEQYIFSDSMRLYWWQKILKQVLF